jgi:hypothetical protein
MKTTVDFAKHAVARAGKGMMHIRRLSRFCKIGGEMVPDPALEDIFITALSTSDPVPDELRGENPLVVQTKKAGALRSGNRRVRGLLTSTDKGAM